MTNNTATFRTDDRSLSARASLASTLENQSCRVPEMARRLVGVPSHYPPGNTHAMARAVEAIARDIPGLEVERHDTLPHVANLVLRLRGAVSGRRLVFNGHMDTFPLVNRADWTADPSGEMRDGKLYGLGVSDMKGGIAAILFAMAQLSGVRNAFAGEVVATLVGDEESMGTDGTQHLLTHVEAARGDAMISADTGSTRVLRFGEKGMLWMRLRASGKSAHAAHVHHGDCAIEKLLAAMQSLTAVRQMAVDAPAEVLRAIERSAAVSESLSGAGESAVLRGVTLTFGTMQGGRLSNLIADAAEATVDVRIPVGLDTAAVEARIRELLAPHGDLSLEILRRYEPSWTAPGHEVITTLAANCEAVLGRQPVVNMRVGASDARLYRAAGIPTVVCGLTACNMGAADEHVFVDELRALGRIYALTAFDFLGAH
ncbi:M20/M25/M40 family metallo-hydrolase [Variovorax sp. PBL-E5]|uniref:M20/M25/M40 family metallo-hydrolase n=1 Tax=Variovorax sp. PBL-E5 TaxID=434014 RepID=UPI001319910E|nr:M20/M25/M40 family metallo-hydrolase [Variovorax sp. PBL-E5]VTU36903.1 Succinyl-diaminopimelate desuccinylase [Variovorax sp. PBL-E5]